MNENINTLNKNKKKITITVLLIFLIAFLFIILYYNQRKNPLLAYKYRNKANKICEQQCQKIFKQDYEDFCREGNCPLSITVYSYNKRTKSCLFKNHFFKKNYNDMYVKDCNTYEYLNRWNPSQEELNNMSQAEIDIKIQSVEDKNIELLGEESEIFLLGFD